MKTEIKTTKCPHCMGEIDVNELVYNNISDSLKSEYVNKLTEEKKSLELKLRKSIAEETNSELIAYKQELSEKVEQLKDLNKTKAELERAKREKDELKEKIEMESEQKFTIMLKNEKDKMRKDLDDKNILKVMEKEHLIDSLKTQIQVLTRKVEQGSMQLQGEVQEIQLENYLKENFPLDVIEEIKKGARGADCLQIINSRERINIGSIYYESKRTKDFSNA